MRIGTIPIVTSTFSDRLRRAIEQSGIGVNDLNRMLGKKPGYLSNTMARDSMPAADVVLELARHLKVRFEWLVKGEEPMQPPLENAAALSTPELAAELARRLQSEDGGVPKEPAPPEESTTRQRALSPAKKPGGSKKTG